MVRAASLTLVIGALLLLTWVLAPAAPHPPQSADADIAPLTSRATAPSDPQHDVDRLRERLVVPPAFRAPTRDPFQFQRAERATKARGAGPATDEAARVVAVTPPPRLIAILSNVIDGALVRRAALGTGPAVRVVAAGDTIDGFQVRAIAADGVELVDAATGAVVRLTLR